MYSALWCYTIQFCVANAVHWAYRRTMHCYIALCFISKFNNKFIIHSPFPPVPTPPTPTRSCPTTPEGHTFCHPGGGWTKGGGRSSFGHVQFMLYTIYHVDVSNVSKRLNVQKPLRPPQTSPFETFRLLMFFFGRRGGGVAEISKFCPKITPLSLDVTYSSHKGSMSRGSNTQRLRIAGSQRARTRNFSQSSAAGWSDY